MPSGPKLRTRFLCRLLLQRVMVPIAFGAHFPTRQPSQRSELHPASDQSFSTYTVPLSSVPQSTLNLPSGLSQTYQRLTYSGIRTPDTLLSDVTPTLRLFVTTDNSADSFLRHQLPHLAFSENKPEGGSQTFYGLCDKGWKRDIDVLLPDGYGGLPIETSVTTE